MIVEGSKYLNVAFRAVPRRKREVFFHPVALRRKPPPQVSLGVACSCRSCGRNTRRRLAVRPSVRPSGRVMSGFWRRRRRPRFSSYWSLCSRSAGRRRAKPRRGYSRTAAERFEEEIDVVASTDDAMWAVREIFPTFGSLGIDFQVWSILCFIAPAPAYILIWMSWAQL